MLIVPEPIVTPSDLAADGTNTVSLCVCVIKLSVSYLSVHKCLSDCVCVVCVYACVRTCYK